MVDQKLRFGRVANDIAHDLSAGLFPGAVAAVWIVRSQIGAIDPNGTAAVRHAASGAWFLLVLALGLLLVTGWIRLQYWRLNVRPGFLETKGQMAAMKHIVFVATQLLAVWALAVI